MVRKCICQICTCRRHKCPHNLMPREGYGECVFSEYKNQFTEHPLQLRSSCKPEQFAVTSLEPLDDKTVNKLDYVRHPIQKPFKREMEKWQKPEGQLESTTNYKNDFSAKPLQPIKMYRPSVTRKDIGKFQGEPTYQTDYRSWGPQPRAQPVIQKDQNYKHSDTPFDASTNYKLEYVTHKAPLTKSMKPLETGYKSIDPFDDATMYKDDYKVHPLEARKLKEKIPWEPNSVPLDDLSNYKKDFTAKDAQKVASCRPEQKAFQSKMPFDESTTHKVDFIPWQAEARSSFKPQESRHMPDGRMDFDTTTKMDYPAYENNIMRRSAIRPLEAIRREGNPFDGTTHYAVDYKPWNFADLQPIERRKPAEYVANDLPFDGQATYKIDFNRKPIVGVKSAKPHDPGFKSLSPLDDMTEYKKEYIGKKIEVCPAGLLVASGTIPRYSFKEQDECGHVWYEYRTSDVGLTSKIYPPISLPTN